MEFYDFEWRLNRSLNTKLAELQRNERLRHVIFSAQFNRELLDYLGSVADMIRQFSKSRKGRRFLGGLLAPSAGHAVFHAAFDAHVPVVHGGLPDAGHRLQRSPRSVRLVGGEGGIAVRFDPHVLELLRHHHHAQRRSELRRVLRLPDERDGRAGPPQRADRQCRLRGRRASDAGPLGHLHHQADVPVQAPQGLVALEPVRRRAAPQVSRPDEETSTASCTVFAATSAAAARSVRWRACCRSSATCRSASSRRRIPKCG